MNDIVERLREWPSDYDDSIEAANEIERLRKDIERLNQMLRNVVYVARLNNVTGDNT